MPDSRQIPQHVLLVRLSAMGDAAMAAPVARALRGAYPDVRITILTRKPFRSFFGEVADIDFIDFQPDGRHKGFRGIVRLASDIKKAGVTAVADLHDVLRTQVLRNLLRVKGVQVSVIDKGRSEKKELTRRSGKVVRQLKTSVQRYRETVARLGFNFDLPDGYERKRQPMPPEILRFVGPKEGVWIGVAPFAKHKGKIYPIALTDALINILSQSYERIFVFGGGAEEQSFTESMESYYPNVVSVIGKLNISQELDVISNLDAMVTMDSSAMHMASLVGVEAVSVWGATHPYAGFYGFGQPAENAVQLSLPCRPCSVYGNRECIFKDYHCLTGIAPETIAEKVEEVVKKISTERGDKHFLPGAVGRL